MIYKIGVLCFCFIVLVAVLALRPIKYSITVIDKQRVSKCNDGQYFNDLCSKIRAADETETIYIEEPYFQAKWNKFELPREYGLYALVIN